MLSRIWVMGMLSKEVYWEEAIFKVQVRREECEPREVMWWGKEEGEMELDQQRNVSMVDWITEKEYSPKEWRWGEGRKEGEAKEEGEL